MEQVTLEDKKYKEIDNFIYFHQNCFFQRILDINNVPTCRICNEYIYKDPKRLC